MWCEGEGGSEEILVWQQILISFQILSLLPTTPLLHYCSLLDLHCARPCIGELGSTTGWAYKAMEGRLVASFHLFSAWKKLVGNGRVGGWGVGGWGG